MRWVGLGESPTHFEFAGTLKGTFRKVVRVKGLSVFKVLVQARQIRGAATWQNRSASLETDSC